MNCSRSHTTLLLALLTVLAYANTTHNGFVWDDHALVTQNYSIRNFAYLPLAFFRELFPDPSPEAIAYYRPVHTITLMADYALWGLNPAGYHFTNLLLHLACVLLLSLLLEQITDNRPLAFAVAALFAVHPVLTNAVTYVSGRADPLAFAAMLGAWLLWLHRRPAAFAGAAICYLAALGSRENAFLFPTLIFLHSRLLRRNGFRQAILDALPFALLAAASGLWRHAVLSLAGHESPPAWSLPWTVRMQIPFRALATYVGLLVWPAHLQMERQVVMDGAWLSVLSVAGAGAVIALAWLATRNRLACFGVCWFAVTLLPLSGLFSLNATVAEHWLYVPCVGLFLAVLSVVPLNRATIIGGAVALVALTTRTIVRNGDWQDAMTFYTRTQKAAPYSSAVRCNLALEYLAAGETNRAVAELTTLERLEPRNPHAKNNLATIHFAQGDLDTALARAEESLRLSPDNPSALSQMALIWERRGDFGRARLCYLQAIGTRLSVSLRMEYTRFLLRQRRLTDALPIAEEICGMEPPNPEAHNLRGVILAELGRYDEAQAAFERAASLDRHSRNATRNLERLRLLRSPPLPGAVLGPRG